MSQVVGKLTLSAWDLGGHDAVRKLWRDYYSTAHAIVFVVDASDRHRFPEAREELSRLLEEPEVETMPVAVLCNKSDVQGSANADELLVALGIQPYLARGIAVQLYRTSIVEGWGYPEAFSWLASVL